MSLVFRVSREEETWPSSYLSELVLPAMQNWRQEHACVFPSLFDGLQGVERQTLARQPRRHASPQFRAVCKSTVKFHFSNPFNQKQGNKASW